MRSWMQTFLLFLGMVAIAISINIEKGPWLLKWEGDIKQLQSIVYENDLWPAGKTLPKHLEYLEEE